MADESAKTVTDFYWEKFYDPQTKTWGMGFSNDNGLTYTLLLNLYGRVYSDDDAKKLWPYLKKYVTPTTPVTTAIKWADILDKPDLVTIDVLNQRLENIASSGKITSLDWGQITNKPDLATKDDLKKISLTPGSPGKNGKSAYEIACDNGFKGSEAEWLQSLHGKNGSATALSGSGMSIDTEKGTIAFTGKMADPASAESKEEVPYTLDINNSGISYTVGGKTTQLVSITDSDGNQSKPNKIDQSNTDKNKMPSDYSDGIFYEQKTATAVGIDRTNYADDFKSGENGVLTTKAVTIDKKKYARQSFELLDNDYPLTLERNGSDSAWNDWHAVTNWN